MFSIHRYLGFLGGACALLLAGTATGAVVFVDVDSPGPTRDGTSWGTAYQTIVAGLTAAGSGDEVWVAEGTYLGAVPLKSNVGIYAGFSGSESSLSQRNWVAHPATLQAAGTVGSLYSAVTGMSVTNATLSGFTITGATGGGVRLFNCTSCVIEHCVIRNNANDDFFLSGGGGVFIDGGSPVIRNCVITANDADYGGGIYMRAEAEPVIQNCTLSGNTHSWGQLWTSVGANPILRNLIMDDSSDYAVVFYDAASLPQEMSNCLFHDAPTALVNYLMTATNNNLAQLNAQTWAEGNLQADPAFVNRAAGDFRLTSASPALDTGLATGAPTTDCDGAPRPYDVPGVGQAGADAFDIGAYEYQGSASVTDWAVY